MPDSKPVEWLLKHLKYGAMACIAPRDATHLAEVVRGHIDEARRQTERPMSFYAGTKLPDPLSIQPTRAAIAVGNVKGYQCLERLGLDIAFLGSPVLLPRGRQSPELIYGEKGVGFVAPLYAAGSAGSRAISASW